MSTLIESGLPSTDLERYTLREFKPLMDSKKNITVTGKAFVHPNSFLSKYFQATPFPFRYKDEPLIVLKFETSDEPSIWRPFYYTLKGKIQYDTIENIEDQSLRAKIIKRNSNKFFTILNITSIELENVENLASKIYRRDRDPFTLRENDRPKLITYNMFKTYVRHEITDFKQLAGQGLHKQFKELLIDGVEIEGKEDLMPLLSIATPPTSLEPLEYMHAGGFQSAFLGQKIASLTFRLRKISTDPFLAPLNRFNMLECTTTQYSKENFQKRTIKKVGIEHGLLLKQQKKLSNLPFDYPIVIANAPSLVEEKKEFKSESSSFYENPDILNYLSYMRFQKPTIDIEAVRDELIKKSKEIIDIVEYSGLDTSLIGPNKLFDPNYYGKPEAILRLAISNARINFSDNITKYIDLANDLLYESLNDAVDQIQSRPRNVMTIKKTNQYFLNKMRELQESSKNGLVKKVELKSMFKNMDEITFNDILEDVINSGYVFKIRNDIYQLIDI